jgi:hypothetical protein
VHKLLFATAAFVGLTAATILGATAAPVSAGHQHPQTHPMVHHVDYQRNHHHWHHRHWEHHHWRYYN